MKNKRGRFFIVQNIKILIVQEFVIIVIIKLKRRLIKFKRELDLNYKMRIKSFKIYKRNCKRCDNFFDTKFKFAKICDGCSIKRDVWLRRKKNKKVPKLKDRKKIIFLNDKKMKDLSVKRRQEKN